MDPTQPPSSDELQFDKAEVAEESPGPLACHACQRSLYDAYFEVNGQPSCEKCRYDVESEQARGSGAARFGRAFVGGGSGALVGAGVYYGVLALTGFEVGIVAILVGFLVGAGVRWGSRGRGGWAYQSLAIALTYVAIVGTYVPLVFQQLGEMDDTEVTESQAVNAVPEAAPAAPAGQAEEGQFVGDEAFSETSGEVALSDDMPDVTAGEALVGLLLFGLFMLALPFLGGFENIMGLVIIGIGLYQAWVMNKRQPLLIEGPFQVGRPPRRASASVDSAAT